MPSSYRMRVRLIRPVHGCIDGIQLDHMVVGSVYEVGVSLACYLMALEAVEPTSDQQPAWLQGVSRPARGPASPPEVKKPRATRWTLPRAHAADRSRVRSKKSR